MEKAHFEVKDIDGNTHTFCNACDSFSPGDEALKDFMIFQQVQRFDDNNNIRYIPVGAVLINRIVSIDLVKNNKYDIK